MLRVLLILLVLFPTVAAASDLIVATFNTESDTDTAPVKVTETIRAMGELDILAVQEVESAEALKLYTDAAAQSLSGRWRSVISESGVNTNRAADLLGIVYNSDRFRQLETNEIHVIRSKPDTSTYGRPDWSLRGALVLRLQHLESGVEFQIATIHLKYCKEPEIRAHQAALLASELTADGMLTILLGDSNIPIEPGASGPDAANLQAFTSLTAELGLAWVQPSNPVKTQCSEEFNSMLDQIFVPSPVAGGTTVEIRFPEAAYCDREREGYSDHRPVVAKLAGFLGGVSPTGFAVPLAPADEEARESMLQEASRPGDSIGR